MPNKLAEELERRQRTRLLQNTYGRLFDHSKPFGPTNQGVYQWARDFHTAGAEYNQRLLMAANRVGKTRTCGAEVACHVTGLYPDWWDGVRFEEPIRMWTGSVTNKASKEIVQFALLGTMIADMKAHDFGTGWIPGDKIIDIKTRQAGLGDVVDSISVKHKSGGESHIGLMTYEQGRASWQGTAKHLVWFDEEPPMDIYTEGMTRLLDLNGIALMSFTPLIGMTPLVASFLNRVPGDGKFMMNVSWDDAPHLDEKARNTLMQAYEVYERDTRTKGEPLMGTGQVFPVKDEEIMIEDDAFNPKPWWRYINGHDFGIDHPAASAFCCLDPSGPGTFYVYDVARARQQTAIYHATELKKQGDWIPIAWPHDGNTADKGSGKALVGQYRGHGARMLKEHAHYPDDRGNHVDPGLIEMLEWMRTGRFKVLRRCTAFFEEKRMYHRDDGIVVKKREDIMSATRYAFMMRRYAILKPTGVISIGSRPPSVPIVGPRRWR